MTATGTNCDKVRVEALLDLDGVLELEEKLNAIKMLLKRRPATVEPLDGSAERAH